MSTGRPIPWSVLSGELGSVWTWETDAFVVTINGDRRSFYWTIADKLAAGGGQPKPFADAFAASFEEAERGIRETIGRAYAPTLGYADYAGDLATTFTIATGERINLGQYAGQDVIVRVATRTGAEEQYQGRASVSHYDFVLTNAGQALRITPSFILSISPAVPAGFVTPARYVPREGAPRTTPGRPTRRCTGTIGFIAGTVDHTGPPCPIHELRAP